MQATEVKASCHCGTSPGQRQASLGVGRTQHLGQTRDLSGFPHPSHRTGCKKSATRKSPPRQNTRATCGWPKRGVPLAHVRPIRSVSGSGDNTSSRIGTRKRGGGGESTAAASTPPVGRKRGTDGSPEQDGRGPQLRGRVGVRIAHAVWLPRPHGGQRHRSRVNVVGDGTGLLTSAQAAACGGFIPSPPPSATCSGDPDSSCVTATRF